MTPELIALNAEIAFYMGAHTEAADWPSSLRAFDVVGNCGEIAMEEDVALGRDTMYAARVVVALWIDGNVGNRPAEYQIGKYLESLS